MVRYLVCVDGTDSSKRAEEFVMQHAKPKEDKVFILNVIDVVCTRSLLLWCGSESPEKRRKTNSIILSL